VEEDSLLSFDRENRDLSSEGSGHNLLIVWKEINSHQCAWAISESPNWDIGLSHVPIVHASIGTNRSDICSIIVEDSLVAETLVLLKRISALS